MGVLKALVAGLAAGRLRTDAGYLFSPMLGSQNQREQTGREEMANCLGGKILFTVMGPLGRRG